MSEYDQNNLRNAMRTISECGLFYHAVLFTHEGDEFRFIYDDETEREMWSQVVDV